MWKDNIQIKRGLYGKGTTWSDEKRHVQRKTIQKRRGHIYTKKNREEDGIGSGV